MPPGAKAPIDECLKCLLFRWPDRGSALSHAPSRLALSHRGAASRSETGHQYGERGVSDSYSQVVPRAFGRPDWQR
jgi:hypothetical protein